MKHHHHEDDEVGDSSKNGDDFSVDAISAGDVVTYTFDRKTSSGKPVNPRIVR